MTSPSRTILTRLSKKKSFLKKFEVSASVQHAKHNDFFPVCSDVGVSVGFRPIKKLIIGIGPTLRVGWGAGFKDIHVSQQGYSLRSYLDYATKTNFQVSAGLETSYFPAPGDGSQLSVGLNRWKRSALAGLGKRIKWAKRKQAEIKLLYDFLARRHLPQTNQFSFRTALGL